MTDFTKCSACCSILPPANCRQSCLSDFWC